jgi:hypothetical protein
VFIQKDAMNVLDKRLFITFMEFFPGISGQLLSHFEFNYQCTAIYPGQLNDNNTLRPHTIPITRGAHAWTTASGK